MSKWALNAVRSVLVRDSEGMINDKLKRGKQCDHKDRAGPDAAISQGMPAATEAERGEDRSSLEGARPHQMSDCWPLGRDNKYPWC